MLQSARHFRFQNLEQPMRIGSALLASVLATALPGFSQGSSACSMTASGNLSCPGTVAAGTTNDIQQCSQFSGATPDVQLANCIAALPSTGGIADARGMQGTFVLHNKVTVPSGVTLLADRQGARWQAYSATQNVFQVEPDASLQGFTFNCANLSNNFSGYFVQSDPSANYDATTGSLGTTTSVSYIASDSSCASTPTGTLIALQVTGNTGIFQFDMDHIYPSGLENGILLSDTGTGWIDGVNLHIMRSVQTLYGIHLTDSHTGSNGYMQGNTFTGLQIEKSAPISGGGTNAGLYAVYFDGTAATKLYFQNTFVGACWDYTTCVNFPDAPSTYNNFIGMWLNDDIQIGSFSVSYGGTAQAAQWNAYNGGTAASFYAGASGDPTIYISDPSATEFYLQYNSLNLYGDTTGAWHTPGGYYIGSNRLTPTSTTANDYAVWNASGTLNDLGVPFYVSYWYPMASLGGSFAQSPAYETLAGWIIGNNVTFGHIEVYASAADSTNLYSIGIYNSSGTAICTTTPANLTSGNNQLACSQGTVKAPAGPYYIGDTTSCASSCPTFGRFSGASFYTQNTSFITTTGGAQPTSITPPTNSFALTSPTYIPAIALVP